MPDLFNTRPRLTLPHLPCPGCGSHQFVLTPGKGPHAAALYCADCDRFHSWMSKIDMDAYRQGYGR